ncbi:glycosyltransferase [candidate division KSB1 bacterium]|nr:glycosyltransferase [candidate division KSB1 bacterium]
MVTFIDILGILTIIGFLIYFLILLYFRGGLSRNLMGIQLHTPNVSVMVPAHNEEAYIQDTLSSLAAQTYSREKLEIVLVNDRSSDETSRIMEDFASKHGNVKVIHIDESEKSDAPKKNAIMRGIEISSGEIIITTDADSTMHPKWIETLVSHYSEGVGLVFGYAPYRTDGQYNTFFHRLLALEYFASGSIAAATAGRNMAITGFGANFSYRKKLFEKIGGFGSGINHHSGDDDLLLNRVRTSSKYKIRFATEPKAAVWNIPPRNLKALIRQRIRFSSKHLAYPKKVIAGLSFIYTVYVLMLVSLIVACFSPELRLPLLIALGLKTAGELLFLLRGQKLLEDRNLLKYYPLTILPHIFYVVLFPILGQILPRKW